jgi:hypothetical protein
VTIANAPKVIIALKKENASNQNNAQLLKLKIQPGVNITISVKSLLKLLLTLPRQRCANLNSTALTTFVLVMKILKSVSLLKQDSLQPSIIYSNSVLMIVLLMEDQSEITSLEKFTLM